MKQVILAAAMLLTGLASNAHAKAVDISSPVETFTVASGKSAAAFGNTFAHAVKGDYFSDRFYFTVGGLTDLSMVVTSISTSKTTGLDLTGFAIYGAGSDALVAKGVQKSTGSIDKWSLTADDLSAGKYYFAVAGTMVSSGASFAANGNFDVTPLPVPEASQVSMLLGGFAVLGAGAALRRRRN